MVDSVSVRPRPAAIAVAVIIDVVCVLAFAAVGRASHDESVFAGLLLTAWPFLAALAVGWLILRAWRFPLAPLRSGVALWLITVAGGMLARAATGAGTAIAFIIVATITLGLLLVGWRAVAALIGRRRPRGSVVDA